MKIKFLIIIGLCIFLALIAFVLLIYLINLELESDHEVADIGGGSLDLDPDLSPSYVLDFAGQVLAYNSIFVAGPIFLGIFSLILIVSNIILQIKKIPTRKYMLIITAGVLIFLGAPWISSGIQSVLILEQLEQEGDWIILIGGLIQLGIGMIFVIPGIIILKKARVRQK